MTNSDKNLTSRCLLIPKPRKTIYSNYIKRLLDIVFSGLAIIFLSPVLIVMSFLELVFHGSPIMYVSLRPGKDGKLFPLLKFRSMTNQKDQDGKLLPAPQRITSFGRFIRRFSLDELTGFFNVFVGHMSIIGPRPLDVEYLPLYNERHRYRHAVRPGLVCLKVDDNERISSSNWTWYDQFENDIYYVENVSFVLDLKNCIKAVKVVFWGSDMRTNAGRVSFDGNNLHETRSSHEIEQEKVSLIRD
jgi:lipopolysaccharide/colanic/teichoic acid biosynthesis glycosyltransferase